MLLWEDSNPLPKRGQGRAQDAAPSDPGRHPPSTGVSERHLRKSTADRGRLLSFLGEAGAGKDLLQGLLEMVVEGEGP